MSPARTDVNYQLPHIYTGRNGNPQIDMSAVDGRLVFVNAGHDELTS